MFIEVFMKENEGEPTISVKENGDIPVLDDRGRIE